MVQNRIKHKVDNNAVNSGKMTINGFIAEKSRQETEASGHIHTQELRNNAISLLWFKAQTQGTAPSTMGSS